mgnify:CR=1 FL=1
MIVNNPYEIASYCNRCLGIQSAIRYCETIARNTGPLSGIYASAVQVLREWSYRDHDLNRMIEEARSR